MHKEKKKEKNSNVKIRNCRDVPRATLQQQSRTGATCRALLLKYKKPQWTFTIVIIVSIVINIIFIVVIDCCVGVDILLARYCKVGDTDLSTPLQIKFPGLKTADCVDCVGHKDHFVLDLTLFLSSNSGHTIRHCQPSLPSHPYRHCCSKMNITGFIIHHYQEESIGVNLIVSTQSALQNC